MSWWSKLMGKPSREEQAKLSKAEQFGRNTAASMVDELDGYMSSRFAHIKEGYLDVLRGNMRDALLRDDHSPILIARADYTVFLETVRETKESMRGQIMMHMDEWIETFQEMGLDGQVERAVTARLDDFEMMMTASGLSVLTDNADDLKEVDTDWRAAHPEQALREKID